MPYDNVVGTLEHSYISLPDITPSTDILLYCGGSTTYCVLSARKRRKQVFISLVNAATPRIYASCIFGVPFLEPGDVKQAHWITLLRFAKTTKSSITNWFISGSALGPIGGLSARQFNSCLLQTEMQTISLKASQKSFKNMHIIFVFDL